MTLPRALVLAAGLLLAGLGAPATLLAGSHASAPPPQDPRAIVVEQAIQQDFAVVRDTLRQQLQDDGWNLIAEIDLGKRLAKKGVDIPGGLVIFKLTSGKKAKPLLAKDETRYVSAMMPCGVSVYGMSDGSVVISRMHFELMAPMMEPEVATVMQKSIMQIDSSIASAVAKLSAE